MGNQQSHFSPDEINEEHRLQELYSYQVLDTPVDEHFQQIAQIAAIMLDVPIVAISFVDRKRQWLKSTIGLPESAREMPRELSFCTHAIQKSETFIVPDATLDARFAENPIVTGPPGVRFYAAAPLITSNQNRLGTLCVLDVKPRSLTNEQMRALELLSKQVIDQLEMRKIGLLMVQKNRELESAQKELKETSEFLTQVTNLLPIGVVCKDVKNGFAVKIWNKRIADATGVTSGEAVGKNDFQLFNSEQAAILRQNDLDTLAKGEVIDVSESLIDIYNRGRRCVRARKIPMRNPQGEMQYILGVVEDVTELKEAQANLIQASKLSSLGEMATGIAHEINNPLMIIRGRAMLLKDMALANKMTPEAVVTSVEKIDQTVVRISKIISGLKSFAREGSQDPFQKISLKEMVDASLELCASQLKGHDITFSSDSHLSEIHLECRSVQIIQVLVNLLNNSVDAISSQQEKWIRLEVKDQNGQWEIRFSDSGSGIPRELRGQIMQPFFTTKAVGKGTGLGLSISKGIIESHHGTLALDIKSPHTCFVISVPKIQAHKEQKKAA
jgi:PAS domain S-box-containing protein